MSKSVESSTMDHVICSQLSSVPSTFSLPSLASRSTAESDTPLESHPSALRPQEMPPTSRAEITAVNTALPSSVVALSASSLRPQRPSPFQSFSSLRPSGPFHPLSRGNVAVQLHFVTAVAFTCLLSLRSATAAVSEPLHRGRRLEDEWTGEWNGEWTAPQNDDYVYECGENCNDDTKADRGGMWIDNDADALALTPDQIITYVSVGILVFMTLLCCVCYPEIMVVAYGKLCGCCGGTAAAAGTGASGGDEDLGMDYVGGAQEKEKKKTRRKSKSSGSRSSRRRSKSRDVELV